MSLLLDVALFLRNTSHILKLSSTQKVILYTLAARVGNNSDAWLKQYELAKECQISKRQLQRDLSVLNDHDLIEIKKIITKKGNQDIYQLTQEQLNWRKYMHDEKDKNVQIELISDTPGDMDVATPPAPCGHGCRQGCGHGCPEGQDLSTGLALAAVGVAGKRKSPKVTIESNIQTKATCLCPLFDKFWSVYPRKEGRKKALAIWQKAKLEEMGQKIVEDVIARQQFHETWLSGFIPLATTYLNGDRWEDEIRQGRPNAQNRRSTGQESLERMWADLRNDENWH